MILLELVFSKGNGDACRCNGIGDLGDTIVGGGVGNGVVGLSVVTASSVSSDLYDWSIPVNVAVTYLVHFLVLRTGFLRIQYVDRIYLWFFKMNLVNSA